MIRADVLHALTWAAAAATLGMVTGAAAQTRAASQPGDAGVELTEAALRLHRSAILVDGHNDLPDQIRERGDLGLEKLDLAGPLPELHTDIPRLRKGGVGAQFWSAYVPPETIKEGGGCRIALEQFDLIQRMVRKYPAHFELALTAGDIERIHKAGKIASLIGLEGGHAIENSLGVLRTFHALGVRYITLTHSATHDWADSATDDPRHGGLSEFGDQVVREMNRLGIMVDISHVSAETMADALRVSTAPVIASHSSAYSVAAHPRNVPDDILREISRKRGIVMVNFFSGFVEPEAARLTQRIFEVRRELMAKYPEKAALQAAVKKWREENPIPTGTVRTVVDHIDHIVKVAGIDCVGLGSDFDGVSTLPRQLEDVSCFPYITQELLNRGYGETDVRKVLGENLLRVMREVERVAAGS